MISISHNHECLLLYASLADTVENNNGINRHSLAAKKKKKYHHSERRHANTHNKSL